MFVQNLKLSARLVNRLQNVSTNQGDLRPSFMNLEVNAGDALASGPTNDVCRLQAEARASWRTESVPCAEDKLFAVIVVEGEALQSIPAVEGYHAI